MATAKKDDLSINTIVGPGTVFRGEIESAGFVRVDGTVRGDVGARGRVVIGERARMESDVVGTSVVVGGVVKGNIFASERVVVLATGLVIGDIITRRIAADDGVFIQGRIIVCGENGDYEARVSEYRDERGVRERALGHSRSRSEPGNG
ncbi:MAG: polymer-forming cytoskeletal protein [Treponemataceae bacterium]